MVVPKPPYPCPQIKGEEAARLKITLISDLGEGGAGWNLFIHLPDACGYLQSFLADVMLIAETDGDLSPAFGGAGFYVFDAFHGGEDSFQGRCDFRFDDFGGGAGEMIGNLHGLAPRRRVELDRQEWNDRQSAQPCYGRHQDDPERREAERCFMIHYCHRLMSQIGSA